MSHSNQRCRPGRGAGRSPQPLPTRRNSPRSTPRSCVTPWRWLIASGIAALIGGSLAPGASAADPPLSFNRDIRPILSDACFTCHGPDGRKRQADLRLDQPAGVFGEGREAVIVRGKPDESPLLQRILSTDESERMPPPETKKTLTDSQKQLLRRWIEQGAPYQRHWAFEPIVRPAPPAGGTATIDGYLNERLRKAGLAVQPEADRETLIRRVSFALTGLPPTLQEIEAFLQDSADHAYERMVDRYLAAPQFGEEMARHWLDVARYADTHGLHLDNERRMWAYRDWVVRAFNANLPFDQFTIWQIAGDLLPAPTSDQLIATGFNRCNVTTSEGGSIDVEFVYRYAVERTTAVAQTWLGLTAGCAVCHDHKYDPLTMREFYSLYAFFNSAADPAMDGNIANTAPFLKLPTPELQAALQDAQRLERETRERLDSLASQAAWTDPAEQQPAPERQAIREVLLDEVLPLGATSRSSSRNAIDWVTDPPFAPAAGRRVLRQAMASSYTDTLEFKLRPVVVPHDAALEFWVRLDPFDPPRSVALGIPGGKTITWQKTEQGLARPGSPTEPLVPGQWVKQTVPASELGLTPGTRIAALTLNQVDGIAYWDALALVGQADPASDPLASLTAWRKQVGTTPPPDLPGEFHDTIKGGPDRAPPTDVLTRLRQFYLAVIARPSSAELTAARAAWEAARAARIIAEEQAPGTMIYRELDKPRDSFIMQRGQYDKPGAKVEPGVPAILPQISIPTPETRLNRLDLARWLVSPENPLPARVTVNRLWQQIYGTGLVKTSYDFGSQGEPPSHPDLLDWLAAEFRESGWDVKRLVKQLVMAEAFRRASASTPEQRAADPGNRLYARGPRFRLDAEQVRDNALFVSGLIDLTRGGRGVNPYQPPNIWEPVGYADSNTRFYLQDHGPALYRRSMYVFLKRTAPPPFMSNFDAPNREQVCTVRDRSNTPLQALQLMNDVQHFEAARALAERTLAEGGTSFESRLGFLYRTVLSRRPRGDETPLLRAAFEKQLELYRGQPEAARRAIEVGESKPRLVAGVEETAAWTLLANLVLNLDETLNRN
ncbi:MAG: PSD1 and planctomycete cytochrome C domain-containing protein [Pirellulales bacterium]